VLPEKALADYEAGHFLFSPEPHQEYGMALVPRAYVERAWSRFLRLQDFVRDGELLPQAVIAMTKSEDQ